MPVDHVKSKELYQAMHDLVFAKMHHFHEQSSHDNAWKVWCMAFEAGIRFVQEYTELHVKTRDIWLEKVGEKEYDENQIAGMVGKLDQMADAWRKVVGGTRELTGEELKARLSEVAQRDEVRGKGLESVSPVVDKEGRLSWEKVERPFWGGSQDELPWDRLPEEEV